LAGKADKEWLLLLVSSNVEEEMMAGKGKDEILYNHNHDNIPHRVVSTDGVFKSKVLDTDDKFSFIFSKAGSYPYFCSIHSKITGKVIVQ
jgi:plastocyanin